MKGCEMAGRYIVREFRNGVKHVWDTQNRSCIHWSKVKDRIPKKEFDKLYEELNSKPALPKISDILSEVVDAYSNTTSVEEIVGALELCKTKVLSSHKPKKR